MQNPLITLVRLQFDLVDRYLALNREMLSFWLSMQPRTLQPVPISRSTSLVPTSYPVDRPFR